MSLFETIKQPSIYTDTFFRKREHPFDSNHSPLQQWCLKPQFFHVLVLEVTSFNQFKTLTTWISLKHLVMICTAVFELFRSHTQMEVCVNMWHKKNPFLCQATPIKFNLAKSADLKASLHQLMNSWLSSMHSLVHFTQCAPFNVLWRAANSSFNLPTRLQK